MQSWLITMLAALALSSVRVAETRVINHTGADTNTKDLQDFAVAKCRQRCFLKNLPKFVFHSDINSPESVLPCRNNPDCYMCYDYCHVLTVAAPDLATAMCTDKLFCTKGCRTACRFHRIKIVDHLINQLANNT